MPSIKKLKQPKPLNLHLEKNRWVLYSGLYSIHWKNGVAVQVEIEGVILDIKPFKKKARKK